MSGRPGVEAGPARRRVPAALTLTTALAAALLAVACASPPPAPPPPEPPLLPAAWSLESPWQPARPADDLPKGPWWQLFGDARLDALAQQALAAHPTLAIASARLAQSQALLAAAGAARLPQLGLNARVQRARISANRPLANYATNNVVTVQNDLLPGFGVSYEADFAGRVDQTIAGARALAEQSAADLENARLLLVADLAVAYLNLRAVDIELDVVDRAIALQRRALGFVADRRAGGVASGLELSQQQAVLDNTLTQVELLRRQRAQFEHAVATLSGQPAPAFRLAPELRPLAVPAVPVGLPSEVLQRRPDVAAAERAMAVANAQVGVARSAFYPSVVLGGALGLDSRALPKLFDAPSMVWSLGATVAQTLFDGGRLKANADAARAGLDASAANYRRTVLVAMQEVEDGLSGLWGLQRAAAQAATAADSAQRVLAMATGRYEGGASTYLEVITAQQAALAAERQQAQLQGQALSACVFLVKALGGRW